MPTNPHSFADRLRSLRERHRLSKTALGKLVGVSTTCVWNWEQGNTLPRAENLLLLSKILKVPPEYLEFGEGLSAGEENEQPTAPPSLPEVIALAKIQIAHLASIDPSKVKITLDY